MTGFHQVQGIDMKAETDLILIAIRDMRMQAGLTQQALAEKAGVGNRSISAFETSRTRSLKVTDLIALIRACGESLQSFFARVDRLRVTYQPAISEAEQRLPQ